MNAWQAWQLWRTWKPVIDIAEKGAEQVQKIMGRNWKTTLAGILSLVITVANAAQAILGGGHVDPAQALTGLTAGLGLILAKDHNVTGGTLDNK